MVYVIISTFAAEMHKHLTIIEKKNENKRENNLGTHGGRKSSNRKLPKGLYINNGKKVVVK